MSMFSDLVEVAIEIFMDDFSVYGSSFEKCLENLETVLQRCQDKNLVMNREKCHFMVTKGIVLGHKNFVPRLEVDQAKVSVIKTLFPPTTFKGIRSFLGHVGFYRRFIRDFSKISRPLCRLLEKDANLILMNHADLHLKKLSPYWLQLLSWQHLIGTKSLKLCVMSVTMQSEQYGDKERKYIQGHIPCQQNLQ